MRLLLIDNPFDMEDIDEVFVPYTGRSVACIFSDAWPEKNVLDYILFCSGGEVGVGYVPNEDDELIFKLDVAGGDSSLFTYLATAVAVVTIVAIVPALSPMLPSVAASAILGGVANVLGNLFTKTPTSNSFEGSQTYSWDGVQNIIGEGNVVPVCYGRHRVGGIIWEGYVDGAVVNGISEDNFLYMVTALSEGPVDQIFPETIKINDKLALLYADEETAEDKFYNAKTGAWQTISGVITDSRSFITEEQKKQNVYAGGNNDNAGVKDPGGYEAHVADEPYDGSYDGYC